ncbi:MAG: hypothetical protein H6525_06405 [Actinobacteria bacterium]|nr:hypothetical protein [Actinomycetota bacterium]MCB9412462.1 hypothetical protein [Actinomycetota bacterium]
MNRRIATTVVAVGLVVVAGCGSSDDATTTPRRSDAASTPAASATASTPATAAPTVTAGATTSASGAAVDLSPPDQTGVGSTWILISGKGPFAVLQSRTREDDGRIRITWATTVDTANEFCFRYGLCTGGPDNYIDNDPATSWAVVDCSTATLVRPWGTDPAGSEQTLRRQGPDTWVDVQTGAMLDSSSAGGGAVAESMWNAACNPGIDPYSTTVDWTQADRRNCPVGRLEVATTNGWHVCLSPESTISEGFATNIANAVGAEGQYGGVPSPNGQAYYFACQWQDLGQGSVNFRALRCGLPPTDIVGGGTVDLVPVA